MKRRKEMSFGDVILNTAAQKRRAAKARREGSDAGAERPRDVFLESCAQIARALEPEGYKWTKSRQSAVRKAGDFLYDVFFQTSSSNIAGQTVIVWIHASVLSPRLKRWRREQLGEEDPSDVVAGGQIGNLLPEHSWMEWDVADRRTRPAVIADAVAAIRSIALPYFGRFEDAGALGEFLRAAELPSMGIDNAMEFLLCFAQRDAAEAAGRLFLRSHNLIDAFRDEMIRPKSEEELRQRSSAAYAPTVAQLARLARAFDLKLTE